jgi:hypothetical protein
MALLLLHAPCSKPSQIVIGTKKLARFLLIQG